MEFSKGKHRGGGFGKLADVVVLRWQGSDGAIRNKPINQMFEPVWQDEDTVCHLVFFIFHVSGVFLFVSNRSPLLKEAAFNTN